jgi:tRNA(fMet)-specific endonuclease VapC
MRRHYLLDTGIAQDYQNGRGEVRERAINACKSGHRVGICVPVLGELWSGVLCSSSRERNLESLRKALATLRIWPYPSEAAEEYGRIFAELRQAGRRIQQVDIQIAAIARTLPNCVLVTKDSDFSAISGLVIENWAA